MKQKEANALGKELFQKGYWGIIEEEDFNDGKQFFVIVMGKR